MAHLFKMAKPSSVLVFFLQKNLSKKCRTQLKTSKTEKRSFGRITETAIYLSVYKKLLGTTFFRKRFFPWNRQKMFGLSAKNFGKGCRNCILPVHGKLLEVMKKRDSAFWKWQIPETKKQPFEGLFFFSFCVATKNFVRMGLRGKKGFNKSNLEIEFEFSDSKRIELSDCSSETKQGVKRDRWLPPVRFLSFILGEDYN